MLEVFIWKNLYFYMSTKNNFMEEKNILCFKEFRDNLVEKREFANGDESFDAHVICKWNGKLKKENLKITLRLTTIGYGEVRLADGDILNTSSVHMDLSPIFQEYEVDKNGALIIRGKSPKMGYYEYVIIEI